MSRLFRRRGSKRPGLDLSGQQSQDSLPSYGSVIGTSDYIAYGDDRDLPLYVGGTSQNGDIYRLSGRLRNAVNNPNLGDHPQDWRRGHDDVVNNPNLVTATEMFASRVAQAASDSASALGMGPEEIARTCSNLDVYAERTTDGTGNIELTVTSTELSNRRGTSSEVVGDGEWSYKQSIEGVPYTDPENRMTFLQEEYKSLPETATTLSNLASFDIKVASGIVVSELRQAGRAIEAKHASESRNWYDLSESVQANSRFEADVSSQLTSVLEQTKDLDVGGRGRLKAMEYGLISKPNEITQVEQGKWTFGRESVGLVLKSDYGYLKNCPPMEPLWISDYTDVNDPKFVME